MKCDQQEPDIFAATETCLSKKTPTPNHTATYVSQLYTVKQSCVNEWLDKTKVITQIKQDMKLWITPYSSTTSYILLQQI